MAELAALRLLAEKGVIEIPAPRRQGFHAGVSGTLYQVEAVGSAIRERIVERRLVSEAGAILTLESGRQVALVLRGHQDVGEFGSVFAVIQVQVDDPEVAWLSPEEIVRRSELSADWLHVVKHGDDHALQSQADELAWQQAIEQLDVDPKSLGLPIGATRRQASESLIHWAVKDALMSLRSLQAPQLQLTASAVGKFGQVHTVPVLLPTTRLEISNVVDEVLFDGYRPDIACHARDTSEPSGNSFRLLVEVAVTNKVKPEKLDLIRAANVACIELDVMSFTRTGAVTKLQLRDLVARDLASKVWLHHPRAARLLEHAQAKADAARDEDDASRTTELEREAEQRKAQEESERADRERVAVSIVWAQGLRRAVALQELRALLALRWAGREERTSNGMAWQHGEFEHAIASLLPQGSLEGTLLARGGIAWRLDAVVHSGKGWRKPLDVRAVLGVGEAYTPFDVQPWLGLLHLAIDESNSLVEDNKKGYEAQRETVLSSIAAGEFTYARPTSLDAVLGGMFPELLNVFAQPIGTRQYCELMRQELEAAKQKIEEERALAEERASEERARQVSVAAAEQERRRLPEAIAAVTYQWVWKRNMKLPPSADEAIKYLKLSKYRDAGQELCELVRDGFVVRRDGGDFASWFASRAFATAEQVHEAREVLEAAWIVQSTLDQRG